MMMMMMMNPADAAARRAVGQGGQGAVVAGRLGLALVRPLSTAAPGVGLHDLAPLGQRILLVLGFVQGRPLSVSRSQLAERWATNRWKGGLGRDPSEEMEGRAPRYSTISLSCFSRCRR